MRSTIGIAFALSALLVLSGCVSFRPPIVGSGVTKVETREVAAFHEVDVSSAFEATVAIGTKQSVALSVDDNLLPLVETEVKDGRLSVRYRAGSSITTKAPQKVAIVVPALDSIVASGAAKVSAAVGETKAITIEAEGASNVDVQGLSSDSVDVDATGASRVSLAGKGKQLTLEASGASRFLAPDVPFDTARVELSAHPGVRSRSPDRSTATSLAPARSRFEGSRHPARSGPPAPPRSPADRRPRILPTTRPKGRGRTGIVIAAVIAAGSRR